MGNTQSVALHERGQRKRAERDARHVRLAKLVDVSGIPETLQERILDAPVTGLLQMMADAITNSETITKVYIARCHNVGYGLNSVTEEAYDEALDAARESDRRRASGGPIRLLEGVPISIKHHLDQRGYDSDCGVAARTFLPSAKDGLIVELIRDAGGIPFVRSQIPQCMMVPESDNFVWGRAINPYSASRTPGGSSGGEGALIAARCSPLGIGSDIGGSIRIPAHFCGVFGFKPTPARVTRKGSTAPRPGGKDGQHAVHPTIGPLGRCTDDLVLAMRALWADRMFVEDPTIPHSPFRAPIYYSLEPRRLRVGYFTNMNFFEPAVACVRAVDESVAALRAAGHEVIEWDPITLGIDLRRASILFYALLGADGGLRAFKSGLEGEALHPMYSTLDKISSLPNWLRGIVGMVLRATGKPRMADLLTNAVGMDALALWQLHVEQLQVQDALVEQWRQSRLDLVICPSLGLPALKHGGSKDLTVACCYTFLWNLVHFPAGIVPVSHVKEEECFYNAPIEEQDDFFHAAVETMRGAAGLPVTAQVVALPNQDELCLYGMKQLEVALSRNFAQRGTVDPTDVDVRGADARNITAPESVVQATLAALRQQ